MTTHLQIRPRSAFDDLGFARSIDALVAQTQELYLADGVPWVVGYSGGKDSTAILQLVWLALQRLEPEQRTKPVHVISTDTLVENPVVAAWVTHSLAVMAEKAGEQGLPITPHRLTPAVTDRLAAFLTRCVAPLEANRFGSALDMVTSWAALTPDIVGLR